MQFHLLFLTLCLLTPLPNLYAAAYTESSSSSSDDEITRSLTPAEYERFSNVTKSIEEKGGIHTVTIAQLSDWITDAYMHDPVTHKILEYLRKQLQNDKRINRIRESIQRARPMMARAGLPWIASESEAIIIDNNRIAQLTESELEEHLQTLERGFRLSPILHPLLESSLASLINHATKGTLDIFQILPLELLDLIHILDIPHAPDVSTKQRELLQILQAAIVNYNLKHKALYNQIKYDPEQNAALEATDNLLNTYYEESGRPRPDMSLVPTKTSFIKRWFSRNK